MCNDSYSESCAPIAPTRCKEYIALKEENTRMLEVLKSVEWSGHSYGVACCPRCIRSQDEGHHPSCTLYNALKESTHE